MVKISENLIRKKSEHNELIIGTLEELSLHQEDIEKIEHIQGWCRYLKILLLQNNLIPKIENLHKLKKLEYLNLAINNVEKIENLDQLESLQKLDLTLNFIGDLQSISNLQGLYNLENLILTGNPCTDFPYYRDYVITMLPQLKTLDGDEIERCDRITAKLNFEEKVKKIIQAEIKYQMSRDAQKERVHSQMEAERRETYGMDEDEVNKRFWEQKSEHCPETREELSRRHKKTKGLDSKKAEKSEKPVKLFAECGRPYNLNQAKIDFDFDDKPGAFELNLHVYKFLDTSLIDVDVQPTYVRATIKGNIFQMALNEEIKTSEATCLRSVTTGNLLVKMPKLKPKQEILFQNTEKTVTAKKMPTSLNCSVNLLIDLPPLVDIK